MNLDELLNLSASTRSANLDYLIGADTSVVKEEVSEERLLQNLDAVRDLIAFYREYPDLFIDDIKGPDSTFNFRFTQRIFLRAVMRHKYVYATFTRGFSKSFLAIMALMIKAILFPGSKLFVTTGGKFIFIFI